ncbi:FtsK/SpoIIIE domain-containing protein [Paenibacillus sp. RUD330]|uniref:FtsK/SpoIIIE domain-containing protein n=1 Tax=Paenibacillus sp. RUD330 TaxID=2023772 RepID=UPI000B92B93B|nr:FtsK/SpoIIIE domain-containing protein [Paenibacillus sp. RUD330]ASS66197.1 DNA translocase FtsK [Paenibacillus sp. RUD330]
MGYAKVKDVIVVSEPHAISVYRRSGTTIHLTMVYADKQSFVERYDHDDDLECFMLFKQAFGPYLDLSEDCSRFTLVIYPKDMKQFSYEPRDVLPVVRKMSLPVMAGKSRKGWEAYDMAKHPHLLISGETGSGKSVALRAILTTLVETCGDRLQLYCADLKRSEFHLFRGIAQKVVVTPGELRGVLSKIKTEMEHRGDLLDKAEEAHIDDLPDPPPYIVLAVDEVSLLRKEKDIMAAIEDVSSIGRALGVFLILSMQRPDAKILDGALKNNLTVRMAFRQSDEINSRIAIGSGEAASIRMSQRGRMYMKGEELKMIQMPYLELAEAKKLLMPYKEPQVAPKGQKRKNVIDAEYTVWEDDEPIIGVL